VYKTISRGMSAERKRQLRPVQHLLGLATCGSDLTKLARFFGSDKAAGHHYTQHYEAHFRTLRLRKLTLLEIGIGGNEHPEAGGASLRMWRAYFPNAQIVGIDIHDKIAHEGRRIRTFRGSQADPAFLQEVVRQVGAPDIVIDDGSHRSEHVIASFKTLFPLMRPGGLYACEDTQTSYWPEAGGSSGDPDSVGTSIGFFKSLIHGLNHVEYALPTYVPTELDKTITAIHFYHNLVFVKKGFNDEASFDGRTLGMPS
jgi:hypothetical protein